MKYVLVQQDVVWNNGHHPGGGRDVGCVPYCLSLEAEHSSNLLCANGFNAQLRSETAVTRTVVAINGAD